LPNISGERPQVLWSLYSFFCIQLQCSILQSDHIFVLLTYYQFFLLFYFEKGSKRSQNSEILHIWKSYLTLEIVKQDKCPKYSCQLIKHILCQTKILCPQLLLICICLVIPCRHVAVESCLVLHSPIFSLFIQFKNTNGAIPVNPPPFRGSLPRKSLISRMDWVSCAGDINLPHTPFPPARYPPQQKNQGQ